MTIESSTRIPSERISAKSVIRLISSPSIMATIKTIQSTIGIQKAALIASRTPRKMIRITRTMAMETKRCIMSSLVASRAVSHSSWIV